MIDLGVVGRRLPRIRALPLLPQVADHVAYGAAVGAVLSRRGSPAAAGFAPWANTRRETSALREASPQSPLSYLKEIASRTR